MNILIIANFIPEPCAQSNSRFLYLAKMLKAKNHSVEVWTSDFCHETKTPKNIDDFELDGILIKHLHEYGYPKNVCIKRFLSHYKFGLSVKNTLKSVEKPDIIYIATPSLTVGVVTSQYCKKNNVKFVIDIQDLWPEAYKMVFNPPIFGNIIYLPFNCMANKIYKSADKIIAVSKTYVDRALTVNTKDKSGLPVFLGTDATKFDTLSEKANKPANQVPTLAYIGTLGASYSIDVVLQALGLLKAEGLELPFVVMGNGPREDEFRELAKKLGVNAEFTGLLSYADMVKKLTLCDIGVNPIKDNAAGSIINKVGDYAMAGIAVLNTQQCKEYRDAVDELGLGLNAENGDVKGVAEAIKKLAEDVAFRNQCGQNNRKWAEDKFDRKKSYVEIVQVLEEMIN